MASRAVICVGNAARSDDGIGPIIAQELRRRHDMAVPVCLSTGEPGELLDLWTEPELVVMVDAVITGSSKPGTVHVLHADGTALPVVSPASSHGIGLAETIELARSLHRLPPDLRLVGIEAGSMAPGTDLTPAVRAAIPEAVDVVLRELGHA